jgi:hypothetical protein
MKKVLLGCVVVFCAVAFVWAVSVAKPMPSKPVPMDLAGIGKIDYPHAKHTAKGCPTCHDGKMGAPDFKVKADFSKDGKFTGCTAKDKTAGCHNEPELKAKAAPAPAPKA